jgi:hypothetical protein
MVNNNQKILSLSMGDEFETNLEESEMQNINIISNFQEDIQSYNDSESEDGNENILIGTSLKQIIESEINADMNGNI